MNRAGTNHKVFTAEFSTKLSPVYKELRGGESLGCPLISGNVTAEQIKKLTRGWAKRKRPR